MRDVLLNESLKRLAAEAATRLCTLVASGDQIPFDVAESAGSESIFHSYRPLTSRFVSERAAELRSLPGFEPAREAVEAAGVAAPYLEQHGEAVPADPSERAERMLVAFLAGLWEGCGEFSLDRARLDSSLAVLDAEVRDAHDADLLIAPVVGLRMGLPRLRMADGLELVRADSLDVPLEAKHSEGMRRAAWEPQLLAVAEQGEEPDSAELALRKLRRLIAVMRIFKAGGVALGPYAFAPTGEGRWRRLATGASPSRSSGYELGKPEAAQLAELCGALDARPEPSGGLAWALRRFEMGLERESALDALSDNLLALRAALQGQGPVGAALPTRAAVLIAPGSLERAVACERIERALQLESTLMAGGGSEGGRELATWLEEGVRGILRRAALGELGTDLSTAADEALIATGLAEGDAQISVSVQVEADPGLPEHAATPSEQASATDPPSGGETSASLWEEKPAFEGRGNRANRSQEEHMDDQETQILEPIPAEDEIRITATNWLDEVSSSGQTLEWPAEREPTGQRERIDSQRVRHLFPVPEDADWEVRELDYDHYNRRAG